MTHRSLSTLAFSAAFVLAGTALAHDDDPKLLDRELPYVGPGFQSPLDLYGRPNGTGTVLPEGASASCPGYTCNNSRLLSQLTLGQMNPGANAGNDCWGYVSPSGREYALMGLSTGTAVVEVTTPGSPVVIAHLSGSNSTWRDMKVFSTYMYAVSEGGGGIQVFDMSNVDSGTVTSLGNVTTGGTLSSHNVAIDTVSGFLYRAGGGNNGLRIYDLNQSLTNPPLVGTWSSSYVHDVEVRTITSGPAAGKQVAYCSTGSTQTLATVDVTNKASPQTMDSIGYPNSGYSHQSWLSEDGRYCYLNDEFDEPPLPTQTYVFDVLDPANIIYLGAFTNGNTAIGHNGYVRGNYLYEANYRSGLRVFDLSVSATNPPESAWLDTYPANDNANYSGMWSCYPYFPSGIVLGSDTIRGLFVMWVGAPQLDISFPNGAPATINADGDTVLVKIVASTGSVQGGTEMLHYDTGSGFVSVPLVATSNGLYNATFPSVSCNTVIDYYISAASSSNIVWTNPEGAPTSTLMTTGICPSGPFSYCVAKTNSCGGTPAISFSGTSSASQSSGFTVNAGGARFGKTGLVIYTNNGTGSIYPFNGGTLCISSVGVRRAPSSVEVGGTSGNCDGTFQTDLNAFASGVLGGNPQPYLSSPGTTVNVQQWGRDSIANGSYLSDGGQYDVGP